jgi:uncharacterized protein (TIGR04255 family)
MNTSTNSLELPHYEKPPVVEVVCGILFDPIETLLTPHIGILWQKFQPDYPFCSDVAPLAPKVEVFNESIETQQIRLADIRLTDVPPLPRVWFIKSDQTTLIQVQRDRFIHNWRKVSPENEYLRYETLINVFQDHLSCFDSFLNEAGLGEIKPQQYELTYINQIPQGQGWKTLEEIGDIFPDFAWRANTQRFLTNPKNTSVTTTFDLPDEIGRLYAVINHVMSDTGPTLSFEITVRGIGNYKSREAMRDWFDIAHDWVGKAFADLTGENVRRNIWKQVGLER